MILSSEARDLLDSYGLQDKAIWINETNAAPTDDPQWPVQRPVYQLDLEQQAAFLVQAAALGLAAGVEHMAVYKLYDQQLPPGGESFGILSPADASPRPAYYAWHTVIRVSQWRDRQASGRRIDRVYVVRLQHRDGHQTLVMWARSERRCQVEINATAEKAQLIDQYGNITLIRPVNGRYTVSLSAARCNAVDGCAVGGPVYLLVQPAGDIQVDGSRGTVGV